MTQQKKPQESPNSILTKKYSNAVIRTFSLKGRKVEPEIVAAWASYLIEIDMQPVDVDRACKAAIADSTVDPYKFTIAQLTAYVLPPQPRSQDDAAADWEMVLKYVRRGGAYHGIPSKWSERTTRAVSCIGGLDRIGLSAEDDLGYIKRDFVDSYMSYSRIIDREEKQTLLGSSHVGNIVKQLSDKTRF